MSDKQSHELFQLQRFLPDLFEGEQYILSQPNPPLPDVIVQLANKRIGIEMTTLIVNEHLVQRSSSQEAILSEAQKIFEQQHQLPLHVAVSFIDGASWRKRDCQRVSIFLADAVSQLILKIKDVPQYQTQFNIAVDDFEHTHISGVSVFYSKQLTVPCWTPLGSFWVPNAPVEQVQRIIERKNNNINGYMSGCDEVWLLLIETGSPYSYFDRFDKLQAYVFNSDFAKTMIGRISKGELIKLNTN